MIKIENALKSILVLVGSVLGLYGVKKVVGPSRVAGDRPLPPGYHRARSAEPSLTRHRSELDTARAVSVPSDMTVYRGGGGPLI